MKNKLAAVTALTGSLVLSAGGDGRGGGAAIRGGRWGGDGPSIKGGRITGDDGPRVRGGARFAMTMDHGSVAATATSRGDWKDGDRRRFAELATRHKHRHRVWHNGAWVWVYGPDVHAYGDDCWWLLRRAQITGSPYWWRRYHDCIY